MTTSAAGAETSGPWRYSFGDKPKRVSARERADRGGEIWVRYTDQSKTTVDRRHEVRLTGSIRDARGRIDKRLEREARAKVERFQVQLASGGAATVDTATAAATLSLREGFALALDPDDGKYPSTETQRYKDMCWYRDRLLGTPGKVGLLAGVRTWEELTPLCVTAFWRRLAKKHIATGGDAFGARAAEAIVDALYSTAAWLRRHGHIPQHVAMPAERWRESLKTEWGEMIGEPVKPKRPRHPAAEYRAIVDATKHPLVDPRMGLAIELAAECRTGQVLRTPRSKLALTDVPPAAYDAAAAGELGYVDIPGRGNKNGERVYLTPEQRRAVDGALSGYLAAYEVARLAGEISDYPLFPGGPMRDRTGRRTTKPLTASRARALFNALESAAGVTHQRGRGWYGLRRQATDLARVQTQDAKVLNALGGWRESATREGVYMDELSPAVGAEASRVRRAIRGVLNTSAAAHNSTADVASMAERLAMAVVEQLLARLPSGTREAAVARILGSAGPTSDGTGNATGTTRTGARLDGEPSAGFG